jgi:hypothetical protein
MVAGFWQIMHDVPSVHSFSSGQFLGSVPPAIEPLLDQYNKA